MSWIEQVFQESQAPGSNSLDAIEAHIAALPPTPSGPRAALAGARATTPGLAFAAGLGAALGALTGRTDRLALAATEAGGGHPKGIQTRFSQGTLTGDKTFVTLGSRAESLVVIARNPDDSLGAFLVLSTGSGITLEDRPPLPIAPEVPHARIRFTQTEATPLPGDGYTNYLKPFRTLEDTHVALAICAAALRLPWPEAQAEQLAGILLGLEGVSRLPALDVGGHIALSGIYQNMISIFDTSSPVWQALPLPVEVRAGWERDVGLLQIAGRVRELRRQKAWLGLR